MPYGKDTIMVYMAFADGQVLLSESPQKLQVKMNSLTRGTKNIELSFNAEKCRKVHLVYHKKNRKNCY